MNLNFDLLIAPGALENDKPTSGSSTRLATAATQFEALLLSQMLKSARESTGSGWLSDGDESGEDTSMSLAEEQLAKSMAASGGLGLARMIIQKMSPKSESSEQPARQPAASATT